MGSGACAANQQLGADDVLKTQAYSFKNEDHYNGQWEGKKKHGVGTYYYACGDKYIGEWVDDKKQGKGSYTFVSGNKYDGAWERGVKHGQGTFFFQNGDKYIGAFEEDAIHGMGEYYYAETNDRLQGTWERNQIHGECFRFAPDGRIMKEQWVQGELKGEPVLHGQQHIEGLQEGQGVSAEKEAADDERNE